MNKLLVATLVAASTLGLGACASGYRNTQPSNDAALVSAATDTQISATITNTLAQDQRLVSHNIRVSTMAGQVELSGFTQSQDDKDRAESIARTTAGVTSVHNDLEVRPQAQ